MVSGYLLQKGYWNDPVRTAEVMVVDEEGKMWMHVRFIHLFLLLQCSELTLGEQTGDEAQMDGEGYIKVVPPASLSEFDWIPPDCYER